jgi:hypothetical protein
MMPSPGHGPIKKESYANTTDRKKENTAAVQEKRKYVYLNVLHYFPGELYK